MNDRLCKCFEFNCYIYHPTTGELLINTDEIENILKGLTTLESYAWIIHDKDINYDGTLVNPHIHLFMKFSKSLRQKTLAKVLNLENKESCFERKYTGLLRSVYLECLTYMTHEDDEQQKLSKHLYCDAEVHFWHINGFTFREFIGYSKPQLERSAII